MSAAIFLSLSCVESSCTAFSKEFENCVEFNIFVFFLDENIKLNTSTARFNLIIFKIRYLIGNPLIEVNKFPSYPTGRD